MLNIFTTALWQGPRYKIAIVIRQRNVNTRERARHHESSEPVVFAQVFKQDTSNRAMKGDVSQTGNTFRCCRDAGSCTGQVSSLQTPVQSHSWNSPLACSYQAAIKGPTAHTFSAILLGGVRRWIAGDLDALPTF